MSSQEMVGLNSLILDNIFQNLGIRDVIRYSNVCRLWSEVSDREQRFRENRVETTFFLFPDPAIPVQFLKDQSRLPFYGNSHELYLVDYFRYRMAVVPKQIIMFHSKFLSIKRSCEWPRRLRIKSFRQYLPRETKFVHIGTMSLIGTSTATGVPYPASSLSEFAGLAYLVLPELENVHIEVLHGFPIMLSKYRPPHDLKCVILLQTIEARGHYNYNVLNNPIISNMHEIWKNVFKFNVAFAGAVVEDLDVSNGFNEFSEMRKPVIVMSFRGSGVSACSTEIETDCLNLDVVEKELRSFKRKLGFDPDADNGISLGFGFVHKGNVALDANNRPHEEVLLEKFHTVFPKTRFFGFFANTKTAYHFWPSLSQQEKYNYWRNKAQERSFSKTSIVIINISKK